MKIEYKTPTMKVVEVQQTHMLCRSLSGINDDEVPTEDNNRSEYYGYGNAW